MVLSRLDLASPFCLFDMRGGAHANSYVGSSRKQPHHTAVLFTQLNAATMVRKMEQSAHTTGETTRSDAAGDHRLQQWIHGLDAGGVIGEDAFFSRLLSLEFATLQCSNDNVTYADRFDSWIKTIHSPPDPLHEESMGIWLHISASVLDLW